MAVLFVPIVFVVMFFFSSWIIYKNIQANNCCMTCGGDSPSPDLFNEFWEWILSRLTPLKPVKPKCPKDV
jgi:hypothetical protein